MTTLELTTRIEAPIETCFQLALGIDLEWQAAKAHHIRAVGGVKGIFRFFGHESLLPATESRHD